MALQRCRVSKQGVSASLSRQSSWVSVAKESACGRPDAIVVGILHESCNFKGLSSRKVFGVLADNVYTGVFLTSQW